MDLTADQEKELHRRYEAAFEKKGDTLTFHEAFEVRHEYFNELREKASKAKPSPTE